MARSTAGAAHIPGAKSAISVLALTGAALSTTEILPGSMMPLMSAGLNTSEGMIGQAVTASALVAIVTSLLLGSIAGNRDRRHLIIALMVALVISNVGTAFASNVWIMLASRLFLGAAIGIIWGLFPAIVLRFSPPGQFAKSFSTVIIGVSAAGVVAPPLAAFAGDAIGWRYVYIGSAVLSATALMALIIVFPSVPARPGALDRDIAGTLRLPGLIAGMLGVMLLFGGGQAFFGYMVPFLESVTGLGAGAVSLVLLATGVSALVGTFVAPRMLARSIHGVLVMAPAALAILLGLLLLTGHLLIPAVVILMLWTFARAHIGIGANVWVAHNFAERAESAGGIMVAVIQLAMMLGAILGGILIDSSGAKAPPVAGAIILAAGAIYCYIAMKPRTALTEPPMEEPLLTPLASPTTQITQFNEELA